MLIVPIDDSIMSKMEEKAKLKGGIAWLASRTKVHRSTIPRILKNRTAEEDTVAKLEAYFNPQPTEHATTTAHTA